MFKDNINSSGWIELNFNELKIASDLIYTCVGIICLFKPPHCYILHSYSFVKTVSESVNRFFFPSPVHFVLLVGLRVTEEHNECKSHVGLFICICIFLCCMLSVCIWWKHKSPRYMKINSHINSNYDHTCFMSFYCQKRKKNWNKKNYVFVVLKVGLNNLWFSASNMWLWKSQDGRCTHTQVKDLTETFSIQNT